MWRNNLKNNTSYSGWNTLAGDAFSASNPYLPASAMAALAASGQSSFKLSEITQAFPRIENNTDTDQFYLNAGLEGSVWGYNWDMTYTHSNSYLDTKEENIFNQPNLAAALHAITSPTTGQIVCRSGASGCVPLDVFGPTAAGSAALNYVLTTAKFKTNNDFDAVDASFRGTPFSTWAGPVGAAISGEFRRTALSTFTNAPGNLFADCTGIAYNCTSTTTVYQTTYPNLSEVSQSVGESAVEVEVPLVRDFFLAKSIDLNAAARYTDYSTSGNYTTWKVGLVWQLNNDLKVRATDSHDIRAPTLYDLYQPETNVPGNFTDVLTGKSVYVPSINFGNPDLKAENGYTLTAGIVYQPHILPGTSLTIDTYHTIIRNAIAVVQGFNAAIQQACYSSMGSSPYCALIQRPGSDTNTSASNAATAFFIEPENIAKVWTYGVDLEADYTRRIFDRRFDARVFLTYQPHIYYEQPGVATIDQGDAGWGGNGLEPSPSTQLAAFFDYQVTDNLHVDLFEHYRNGFHFSGVQNQVWSNPIVPSFATTTVTLAYDLGNRLWVKDSSLYFSVTNVFNSFPPLTGYYSGSTSAGQAYEFADDPVGRAFVIGIRIKD